MEDQNRKEFESSVIRACDKKDYSYTKTVLNRDVNGDYCQMWVDSAWIVWQEKESEPSDLEIVQKALDKKNLSKLVFYPDGGWTIFGDTIAYKTGDEFSDLLTWAKQTVGYE